jgi:hypothetical protein
MVRSASSRVSNHEATEEPGNYGKRASQRLRRLLGTSWRSDSETRSRVARFLKSKSCPKAEIPWRDVSRNNDGNLREYFFGFLSDRKSYWPKEGDYRNTRFNRTATTMITNERQYKITRSQATKFEEAIKHFSELTLWSACLFELGKASLSQPRFLISFIGSFDRSKSACLKSLFLDSTAVYLDDERHKVDSATSIGRSDDYQEAVAKAHLRHQMPVAMQLSLADLLSASLNEKLASLCKYRAIPKTLSW